MGFAVPGQVVVPGSRYALRANGHWVPLEDPVDGSAPRSPAAAITHEDAAEAQRERDRALSELQAQGELERMGAALAEAQAEAHRLQTELSQARPEAAARAAEVESLQGQLQGIRGDLETVRAEAESLRQAIVAAQSERDHALAMSERNETAVTALKLDTAAPSSKASSRRLARRVRPPRRSSSPCASGPPSSSPSWRR